MVERIVLVLCWASAVAAFSPACLRLSPVPATGATVPLGRLRARSWAHDACCCFPTHHGEHGTAHVRFASIASSTSARSDSAAARPPGGLGLAARDNDGAGQVDEALKTVNALIAKRKGSQAKFELVPKDEKMEQAIKTLKAYNPTPDPGKWDSPDKTSRLADGQWEVLYAPHMYLLQKALMTEFGPRYILGTSKGENTIVSNVRYESPLFGNGWLNAAGTYNSVDRDTVQINFERFWWDINTNQPSADTGETSMTLVQAIGKAAFIPAFSRFPVGYVDQRLCEFQFQASGTSILAVKVY